MADRISDSRTKLFDALTPLLPPGRVSKYVPKSVVSPTIWVERHSWAATREQGAQVVIVSWRIVAASDADDDQAKLDELSAQIFDVVTRAHFRPLFADFTVVDVGGASTSALVVTVEQTVAATTLCLPPDPIKKELVTAYV